MNLVPSHSLPFLKFPVAPGITSVRETHCEILLLREDRAQEHVKRVGIPDFDYRHGTGAFNPFPFEICQSVECLLRGTGGYGFATYQSR